EGEDFARPRVTPRQGDELGAPTGQAGPQCPTKVFGPFRGRFQASGHPEQSEARLAALALNQGVVEGTLGQLLLNPEPRALGREPRALGLAQGTPDGLFRPAGVDGPADGDRRGRY